MPTWASTLIVIVATGIGGFMLRYLITSSRNLGELVQMARDHGDRLQRVERWQDDRDADQMAQAYGYRPRYRR